MTPEQKARRREYNRQWHARNRVRRKDRARERYAANPEEHRARARERTKKWRAKGGKPRKTPEQQAHHREYNKLWQRKRREDPEYREKQRLYQRATQEARTEYQRKRRARITGAEEGKSGHPGSCEICMMHVQKLCLDHDHDTGQFTGWLCSSCNVALGHFREDPRLLLAAIGYLARTGKKPRRS